MNSPFYDQLEHGFTGLRFSGIVEEEFLSQFVRSSLYRSRLLLTLALAYTLINIGASISGRGGHPATLVYDILVMMPVLGASLWISMKPDSHRLYRLLLTASSILIGMWANSIVLRASLQGMPYYFSIDVAMIFVIWLFLGLPFRHAAVASWVIFGFYAFGVFSWDFALDETVFTVVLLLFVNIVGAIGCYQFEHAKRRSFLDSRVLSQLAERDGLTGLYNRRSYDEHAVRIWRQSRRENEQLALILVDIDHFKTFNDFYGHQAGDDALKAVASVISLSAKRPLDFAARYGGEEFALILYGSGDEYGREQSEQLRKDVRDLKIVHAGSPTDQYLTVSIGVALVMPGSERSLAGAIQMADEALYQAKEDGRNRVVVKASDSQIQTGRFRADKAANG